MESSSQAGQISELRIIVGYLGEKEQFCWWDSSFMASSSKGFLTPIFPRSTWLARYYAVTAAACLVHDERIGVGANYHLYRLPDFLERSAASLVEAVVNANNIHQALESPDAALERLHQLSAAKVDGVEGPVSVHQSNESSFEIPTAIVARHYLDAFQAGVQSFPFIRGLT